MLTVKPQNIYPKRAHALTSGKFDLRNGKTEQVHGHTAHTLQQEANSTSEKIKLNPFIVFNTVVPKYKQLIQLMMAN
jgi:hypothetical protein